jgi:hypothetical protein
MPKADDSMKELAAPLQGEPVNRKSDGFKSFYANNTAFATSAFDFSMTFGEIAGVEGDHLLVDQHVRIIMAPLHMKIVLMLMLQQLKQFEQQFGEIKIPAGVIQASPDENG